MIKKYIAAILIFAFIFEGCALPNDDINPAPVDDETYETDETDATTAADIDTPTPGVISEEAWNAYDTARKKAQSIEAREFQIVIYTKEDRSEGSASQTISLKVKEIKSQGIAATGTVKAGEDIIPIEFYYTNGKLYSVSGENLTVEEKTYEEAINLIDPLQVFHADLQHSYLLEIIKNDMLDGNSTVQLTVKGKIGGVETLGTGEAVINTEGLISSESYSLDATETKGNMVVKQSVESTLIATGTDVTPIVFPANIVK